MQKKWEIKYLKQRVLESVFFPIIVSIFFALVLKAPIYSNYRILAFISFIIFFVYNIVTLERHNRVVRHRKYFYPTNFAVQGINCVVSLLASLIKGDLHLVLFMPYSVLVPFGFSKTISTLVVNLFVFLLIVVIAFIMRQLRKKERLF